MEKKNDLAKRVLLRFFENVGHAFLALISLAIGITILVGFMILIITYPIILLFVLIFGILGVCAISAYKSERGGKNGRSKKSNGKDGKPKERGKVSNL